MLELKCSGFASTSFSCCGGQPEHEHDRVSRVSLRPRVRIPPKLSHSQQSSAAALLLSCSGSRCYGHVPHGQWALLDTRILALIDRSVCLVEPHTCDRRIKCSRLTVRSRLSRERHRGVFAPRSLHTCSGVSLSLWACVSRLIRQPDKFSHWRQLFLYCTLFARQLRFTSAHLGLNLFDSGGLTNVRLCARSHASPRAEPPLLGSAW